eukprot:5992719-Pleurochrysis_carterae.AAC.1
MYANAARACALAQQDACLRVRSLCVVALVRARMSNAREKNWMKPRCTECLEATEHESKRFIGPGKSVWQASVGAFCGDRKWLWWVTPVILKARSSPPLLVPASSA